MLEVATDVRSLALIHLVASTGVRIGAIQEMKLKHLEDMPLGCKSVLVYPDDPEEYHTYFRVLETDDEYFPYYKKYHAFWKMYGLALPDEILKKLYYKNALKVVPGIDQSLFPD